MLRHKAYHVLVNEPFLLLGSMEIQEPSYYEKTGGQVVEITEAGAGKSKISEGTPLNIGKWQFADENGTKIGEIVVTATFILEKPEGI